MTAARLSLTKYVLAFVVLALAGFLQIAGSGSASASGQNHTHLNESEAMAVTAPTDGAVELVYSVARPTAPLSAVAGCGGPDHDKGGASEKSCCGSMCGAAALAWAADGSETPGRRTGSSWLFTQQFVLANAVFGLDRPPDFSV